MAGPPTDISPSDLFRKLQERPAPSEVCDLGEELGRVRFLVLRGDQHDQARVRARAYLKEKLKLTDDDLRGEYGATMMGDAAARELIAMSAVTEEHIPGTDDKPQYSRHFRHAEDVNKLSTDEIRVLFGAYLMVQRRLGPHEYNLGDGEVNAWISRLTEGASVLPLARLESWARDELCLSLAQRASCLSQLLTCLPENLQMFLESIPGSWGTGTSYSTEPAAEPIHSRADLLTQEEAMAAALAIARR